MKPKMVRHTRDSLPKRSEADEARLTDLFSRPESEIDLSDIPESSAEELARAIRGGVYRPAKAQITAKIDRDVLAWLKTEGRGYQTRMNAILRRAMLQSLRDGKRA